MDATGHQSLEQLLGHTDHIQQSPKQRGTLELIVRRPQTDLREVVQSAELDLQQGLVGDNWLARGSKKTGDGSAHPDMQLNLMNSRSIAAIAGDPGNWPLAGDQLFVDLDLSDNNLPPGTRLSIGSARIEITAMPHLGCLKFSRRFGADAVRFVNSDLGKLLNLRGVNARVVQPGSITRGDAVEKVAP